MPWHCGAPQPPRASVVLPLLLVVSSPLLLAGARMTPRPCLRTGHTALGRWHPARGLVPAAVLPMLQLAVGALAPMRGTGGGCRGLGANSRLQKPSLCVPRHQGDGHPRSPSWPRSPCTQGQHPGPHSPLPASQPPPPSLPLGCPTPCQNARAALPSLPSAGGSPAGWQHGAGGGCPAARYIRDIFFYRGGGGWDAFYKYCT